MNKKVSWVLFLGIVSLGIALRLYHFSSPIADWHSWRQVDTSSVSRDFVQKGFDLLHPTYHDLSNVPSGMDNPQGYRFVEFPIFNALQAGGYVLFNIFTLEEWGRLVSIGASVLAMIMIYLLAKRHFSQTVAWFSMFFFAAIPFSFYYGRTILPDQLMTATILTGIYFFDRWGEMIASQKSSALKTWSFWGLSLFFTAVAFLIKPYALFFTLPMLALSYRYFGFGALKKWQLWAFLIAAILPLIFWRVWMTQFPEGIPVNDWLFNGGNIRFKGAYFYWVFADRIGRLILGYWGVGLFLFGVLALLQRSLLFPLRKSRALFFYSFLLSSLLYLVVIARGNVQHDYYQILIIPTLSIFSGIGASYLLNLSRKDFPSFAGPAIVLVTTIFMLMFGWYHVRDYYNINNPSIITAGQAVAELTEEDAKVIANYTGDTTFLYHTERKGWASYTYDMPKMIELGANYLVLVNPTIEDYKKFGKDYSILKRTDTYVIFDLTSNT